MDGVYNDDDDDVDDEIKTTRSSAFRNLFFHITEL